MHRLQAEISARNPYKHAVTHAIATAITSLSCPCVSDIMGAIITVGRVSKDKRMSVTPPPQCPHNPRPPLPPLPSPQHHPTPAPNTASSGALRCKSGGSCQRGLKSIDALQQAEPLYSPTTTTPQHLSVNAVCVRVCSCTSVFHSLFLSLSVSISDCFHFNICTSSNQQFTHTRTHARTQP